MELSSPAFESGGIMPARYTCDGSDVSPPLRIDGIPPGTVGLVLVMDDPDAPHGPWDHWVNYDVPPVNEIPEGVGAMGTPGLNSWGRLGYGGPCPPTGVHRYVFRVLALDAPLPLPAGATKAEVLAAARGHVLDQAVLVGRYRRH